MKFKKIILIVFSFSVIIALFTVFQRVQIEQKYKYAEITLDYNEIEKLSKHSDNSIEWWLQKFNNMGAESTVILEETINSLIDTGKDIKAEIVIDAKKRYNWEQDYCYEVVEAINKDEIDLYDGLLIVNDEEMYNYLVEGLENRYNNNFFKTYKDDNIFYIVIDGTVDDLLYGQIIKTFDNTGKGVSEKQLIVDTKIFNVGIGYDIDKIDNAKKAGLDIILRPINFTRINENLVDAYVNENEKYDINPRVYIAYGKEILGYPKNEDKLIKYVNENNIVPVMIESGNQREHIEQLGLYELVENTDYEAARGFTLWDYIRKRYKFYNYEGAEEIENSLYRAITERNIRIVYFKPFLEGNNKILTDIDEYEKTFSNLSDRLGRHNIKIGKLSTMSEFGIGNIRLLIITLGIALAGAYLFIELFNIKNNIKKIIYILAMLSPFIIFLSRNIAEKGFSFLASIIFSGLGIYYLTIKANEVFNNNKDLGIGGIIKKSTITLLVVSIFSITGALFVTSVLSNTRYMLEMDIFRGVKLSQLIPFVIFILAYFMKFLNKENRKNAMKTIVNIAKQEIKVYYVAILALIAVVGYIYISRTGHETSVQPSEIEMIFRNFMENILIARPRSKEFLIAFPAIFSAIFAANKKLPLVTFIFLLASVIATSDIINTFCHIRTPIYLSLIRTIISIGFGIVLGVIAVIILNFLYKFYIKILENIK